MTVIIAYSAQCVLGKVLLTRRMLESATLATEKCQTILLTPEDAMAFAVAAAQYREGKFFDARGSGKAIII